MELRHLRYFAAVAESGSLSAAAEKLFIAQPALSKQIRQLEEELGVLLFARHARGVVLTAAGKALLPEVRVQLTSMGRLVNLARRAKADEIHCLRIGLVPTATGTVLPELAARLRVNHPGIDIDVRGMESSDQVGALLTDEIDLGIACIPPRHAAISVVCELDDTLCIALHCQDPRAQQSTLDLRQFAEDRFAAFTEQPWLAQSSRLSELFTEAGYQPYVHYEAATVHGVLDVVAAHLAVALVPATVGVHRPRQVVLRALDKAPRCQPLTVLRRRADNNPVLVSVEPAMREIFSDWQRAGDEALTEAASAGCLPGAPVC
ncbi:LysR substrate-binding domain-containing protein [Aquabacterium sp. A7-Y]|uniref:LysR family transcriptional regulator n=1 Tax=Aquabacterium sp. A7-Y TaxID=1349605 RepID=UPI00223DD181|nr:LysR substrate-binding domain-containing protein [Aquabacterium sp. A7-Y]MCW7536268.1 LysR substrate-binding domain-containing protein [Aquabacterium sp. A7-Y]